MENVTVILVHAPHPNALFLKKGGRISDILILYLGLHPGYNHMLGIQETGVLAIKEFVFYVR